MTTRQIADSAILAVVSRLAMLSMAPVFAATVWFGAAWLDGRFVAQTEATAAVVQRINTLDGDRLTTRVTVLESNDALILHQLGTIQDGQAKAAVTLGSVTATLRTMQGARFSDGVDAP